MKQIFIVSISILLLTNCYSQVIHLNPLEEGLYSIKVKIKENTYTIVLIDSEYTYLAITLPAAIHLTEKKCTLHDEANNFYLTELTIGKQTAKNLPIEMFEHEEAKIQMTIPFLKYFGEHIFDRSASLLIMLEDQSYIKKFRNVGNGHWKPYLTINFVNEDCLLYDDPNLSTSVKFLRKGEMVSLWEKDKNVSTVSYGKDFFYVENKYLIEIEMEDK